MKDFCEGQWDFAIKDTDMNRTFKCWSEYHAILKSLIDGRIIETYIDPTCKLETIHEEFSNPQKSKSYYENIKNKELILLEDIFMYCAKLHLCEQYMENFNVENYVPDNIMRVFPSFSELYEDLKEITTYEDAKRNLRFLSSKLHRLNFIKINC